MKTASLLNVISALLILLFVYTAVSKLTDFDDFKEQMFNQAFPRWMAVALIYTLPGSELLVALSLLFDNTRRSGFYASAMLMLIFTCYVGFVLLHFFSRVPCSCGGVLKAMGWKVHFFFNLFFLLLSVTGLYTHYRERRNDGT